MTAVKVVQKTTFLPIVYLFLLSLVWLCAFFIVFNALTTTALAKPQKKQHTYTLRIEFSPASCFLNPEFASLRKCKEGFAFTIKGLRPEPLPKTNCSIKPASLAPLQAKLVSRIMPDKTKRDEVWQRYGSCTNMNSPQYFRLITNLSGKLRLPKELSSGNDYVVNREKLEDALVFKNRSLKESHISLICQESKQNKLTLLTEIQVCYNSKGKYTHCQTTQKVTCPVNFNIRGLP